MAKIKRLTCPFADGPCYDADIGNSDVGQFASPFLYQNYTPAEVNPVSFSSVFDGDTFGSESAVTTGTPVSDNSFFSGVNGIVNNLANTAVNGFNAFQRVKSAQSPASPTVAPSVVPPINTNTLMIIGGLIIVTIIATR